MIRGACEGRVDDAAALPFHSDFECFPRDCWLIDFLGHAPLLLPRNSTVWPTQMSLSAVAIAGPGCAEDDPLPPMEFDQDEFANLAHAGQTHLKHTEGGLKGED
jgi:hypothetical protein